MSGHSPGPWRVTRGYYPGFIEIKGPAFTCSIVLRAYDLSFDDSCRRRCDAQLMAASPRLLAALCGLLDALPSATTHPAISEARAAIADATTIEIEG